MHTQSYSLVKEIPMHTKAVTKLLVSSYNEVWSCSSDGTVKVWDTDGTLVCDARAQSEVFCLLEICGARDDTKVTALHLGPTTIGKVLTAHLAGALSCVGWNARC